MLEIILKENGQFTNNDMNKVISTLNEISGQLIAVEYFTEKFNPLLHHEDFFWDYDEGEDRLYIGEIEYAPSISLLDIVEIHIEIIGNYIVLEFYFEGTEDEYIRISNFNM